VLTEAEATYPDPLSGYHMFIIDGKRLDGTEHRLTETRCTRVRRCQGPFWRCSTRG